MRFCVIGTNFDKFPIIEELIESMRESGEDITLVNWFARQSEEIQCDNPDGFIYVDIYPLQEEKPYIHITREMTEDEIIESINDFSELVYQESKDESVSAELLGEQEQNNTSVIDTEINETLIEIEKCNNSIQDKIIAFKFTIDGKHVELSKEDTNYLIKVFDIAKENGYILDKVIIDEETSSEQPSEDID